MKFALELDGHLVRKPFETRGQVGDALDVVIDTTPQTPIYELYVLIPLEEWDRMKAWIEDLFLMTDGEQ
jgi:hypothetical protein